MPAKSGDLYFTVESYYAGIVPNVCTTGTYTYTQNGQQQSQTLTYPLLFFAVYNLNKSTTNFIEYKYYVEQYQRPIVVQEADYAAGDVFKVSVQYLWFGSPASDFTVGVYSKQSLEVKDSTGAQNKIHMDGSLTSGFTSSTYLGMNGWSAAANSTTITPPPPANDTIPVNPTGPTVNPGDQTSTTAQVEVKSFVDLFNKATSVPQFFTLFFENPWVLFVWFNFW